ncbi:MAG: hypothetical protein LBG15_09705 [Dysgonamonadaceae bacterium]|jgi:hypothetical protein|nr:hypothetical protein [Dysgonamonadaceae bacterium]
MKTIVNYFFLFTVCLSCTDNFLSNEQFNVRDVGNVKSIATDECKPVSTFPVDELLSMNDSARLDFESKNGYKSFATKCEEIYFSPEFESLESQEEVFKFVEDNSNYIEIIVNEDGELECLPKMFRTQSKYLLDENLQPIPVFNQTDVSQIIYRENHRQLVNTIETSAELNESLSLSSSLPIPSCTQYRDAKWVVTEGKDRVQAFLTFGFFANNNYIVHMEWTAQPMRKTLGIWFNVKRTVTSYYVLDIKKGTSGVSSGQTRHASGGIYNSMTKTYFAPVNFPFDTPIDSGSYNNGFYILNYTFYAKSAAINGAINIECYNYISYPIYM